MLRAFENTGPNVNVFLFVSLKADSNASLNNCNMALNTEVSRAVLWRKEHYDAVTSVEIGNCESLSDLTEATR
jgi:hypothetical protein